MGRAGIHQRPRNAVCVHDRYVTGVELACASRRSSMCPTAERVHWIAELRHPTALQVRSTNGSDGAGPVCTALELVGRYRGLNEYADAALCAAEPERRVGIS
jgi:hypothetical protein